MGKLNMLLLAAAALIVVVVFVKMITGHDVYGNIRKRKNIITMKGTPLTLLGKELKIGDKAPDFKMLDISMNPVTLKDSTGKIRLFSVVYSLDTGVCDLQTLRFESEALKTGPNVIVYAVSMDLPFMQKRYCGAKNISALKTLSDYKDASFGINYGVLIEETRLLARSVFIVDDKAIVRYVEYVKDISNAPNFDNALKALKEITESPK